MPWGNGEGPAPGRTGDGALVHTDRKVRNGA